MHFDKLLPKSEHTKKQVERYLAPSEKSHKPRNKIEEKIYQKFTTLFLPTEANVNFFIKAIKNTYFREIDIYRHEKIVDESGKICLSKNLIHNSAYPGLTLLFIDGIRLMEGWGCDVEKLKIAVFNEGLVPYDKNCQPIVGNYKSVESALLVNAGRGLSLRKAIEIAYYNSKNVRIVEKYLGFEFVYIEEQEQKEANTKIVQEIIENVGPGISQIYKKIKKTVGFSDKIPYGEQFLDQTALDAWYRRRWEEEAVQEYRKIKEAYPEIYRKCLDLAVSKIGYIQPKRKFISWFLKCILNERKINVPGGVTVIYSIYKKLTRK